MAMLKNCQSCGQPFRVFPTTAKKRIYCSRDCSEEHRTKTEPDRFWAMVDMAGDCWTWTGSVNAWGYGAFMPYRARTHVAAHRYSWVLHNGPIPDGLCVLHRCDNPPCVNPAHLYVGTHKNNSDDKRAKGRDFHPLGEDHAMSKLRDCDVLRIRELYSFRGVGDGKMSGVALSREYGVTPETIYAIIQRRNWTHI